MSISRNACFSDFRESNKDATMLHQLCYDALTFVRFNITGVSRLERARVQGSEKLLSTLPHTGFVWALHSDGSLHALNESRR